MEIPNDVWFHHILPHIDAKYLIYVCKTWYSIYINHIFDGIAIDYKFIDKILPYERTTHLLLQTKEISIDMRDYLFSKSDYLSVIRYLSRNKLISIASADNAIVYGLFDDVSLVHVIEDKTLCVNKVDVLLRAVYIKDINFELLCSRLNINGDDIDRLCGYMVFDEVMKRKDRKVYIQFISAVIRHPSTDITSHNNVLLVSCLREYKNLLPVLLEQGRVNNIHNITKVILQNYPRCNSLMQLTGISPMKTLSYILNTYITVLSNK